MVNGKLIDNRTFISANDRDHLGVPEMQEDEGRRFGRNVMD